MPVLTARQVAGIVVNPPTGSTVAEWVAKARQESGFNTDIEDFLGSGHWGLWQISEDHWNKPWNNNVGSKENFAAMLKGANFNWRQAQFLYSESRDRTGNGWRPWAASGGKPTPSPSDREAAANPDTSIGASGGEAGDPGEAVEGLGIPNPVAGIVEILEKAVEILVDATKWITNPDNWVRIAQVGGGVLLAAIAASIVLKPAVQDVVKTVKPI